MHIRARNFNKSKNKSVRDLASIISSKESVTQRERLETIIKDTSNVWSTTSQSSMALQGSHQSLNVGTTIKYNMKLEYHMEKSLGAKIYVKSLGRFVFIIDDHKIEFRQEVLVTI